MTLAELVTSFKRLSGRYDMTNQEIAEQIYAGQQLLDRRSHCGAAITQSFFPIAVKTAIIPLESLRWVSSVAAVDETGNKYLVTYVQQNDLNTVLYSKLQLLSVWESFQRNYANAGSVITMTQVFEAAKMLDPGIPIVCSVANIRVSPDLGVETLDPGLQTEYLTISATAEQALQLFPAVRPGLTLIVNAVKYTEKMTEDAHESFWARRYSKLLLYAALYFNETDLRNTEGAMDWLQTVERELRAIEYDSTRIAAEHIREVEG